MCILLRSPKNSWSQLSRCPPSPGMQNIAWFWGPPGPLPVQPGEHGDNGMLALKSSRQVRLQISSPSCNKSSSRFVTRKTPLSRIPGRGAFTRQFYRAGRDWAFAFLPLRPAVKSHALMAATRGTVRMIPTVPAMPRSTSMAMRSLLIICTRG